MENIYLGGMMSRDCVPMVRGLAHTPRRRDIPVDAPVLEAVLVRVWYCILPRHFGPIPDSKAEKCLEKECTHLCYGDEKEGDD